jgi:hypothetical protein
MGENQLAISDFTQAITFQPLSPQAYFARAQANRAVGNSAAADRDHAAGRFLDGR